MDLDGPGRDVQVGRRFPFRRSSGRTPSCSTAPTSACSGSADFRASTPVDGGPRPKGLDHIQAGALPLASLTAWQALVDTANVQPGQRVLIHAAAGGVGHLAVQVAKARGAYVIGTASAAKHELLRSLGADELIDYRTQDFTETLRDVDVVLDALGGPNWARSLQTLRPGGTLISILPPNDTFPAKEAEAAGVRAVFMLVEPDHAGLREITSLVEDGRLRVIADEVFPLEEAARAHTLGETGRTTGKIVLSVTS